MKKFIALLVALAMVAFNALAAVNVNTATQEQLETLNGIGPAKAKAIIDYRTKNGPFKTVEELDNVPGVGQGILGKIKADVTVSGATSVKAAEPGKPAKPATSAAPAAPVAKPEAAKPAPAAAAAALPGAKPEPAKPVAETAAETKDDAKADKQAKKEAKKAEKEAKKAEKDAAKPEAKSDTKK